MTAEEREPARKSLLSHVDQTQLYAQNISGDGSIRECSFVPIDELRAFFTDYRTRHLLDDYYGLSTLINPQRVQTSFLAVFSILIAIGKASHLHHFTRKHNLTDKHLPFRSCNDWHPECRSFFNEFYSMQWKFCAQVFEADWMSETQLDDPNIILPIIHQRCLKNGPDAYTYWIKLHPSYDNLHDKTSAHQHKNEYLLKACKREHETLHHNEVRAYRILSTHAETRSYLPRFYGSWTIGDTYYMLLEYIEGGTLTQFMEENDPPEGREELMQFWKAVLRITIPVVWIHSFPVLEEGHLDLQGIHHDIKPDNILVKYNGDKAGSTEPESRFDIVLMLSDLGLTDIMNMSDDKIKAMRDKPGTQTYSSPENFVNESNDIHCRTARKAEPSKDIWALGCVFSQALVWSVLRAKGLSEYQAARANAISMVPELRNTAYSECFHDGHKVLEAVLHYHRKASESQRGFDKFTPRVQELIRSMLNSVQHRLTAIQVWNTASNIIEEVEKLHMDAQFPKLWQTASAHSSGSAVLAAWSPIADTAGLGVTGVRTSADTASSQSAQYSTRAQSPVIRRIVPPELPTATPGPASGSPSPNRRRNVDVSISSITEAPISQPNPRVYPPLEASHTTLVQEGTARQQRLSELHFKDRRHTTSRLLPEGTTRPKHKKHRNRASAPVVPKNVRVHSELPTMTIDEVIDWITQTKDKPTPLPHKNWLNKLGARDQIFLIDDSETMRPYWGQVKRTFEALAYLVKRSDYDGIELHFTNDMAIGRCSRHRAPLLHLLGSIQPGGKCDIGVSFGRILHDIDLESTVPARRRLITQRFKKKKNWGTSIYVLTNGMWENESDWRPGIVEPLKQLMKRGVQKAQVGVQFIQLGDDPDGTIRLRELDSELAQYGVERDMVDTTHADGNVFKMLLGSFDPSWDHCESPRASASPESFSEPFKAKEIF